MENNKTPEIRFAGFDSEWIQMRIGNLGKLSAGADINQTKLVRDGIYPVIANALTNEGIIGYYNDYKIKAPAITITGRGNVGHAKARFTNFTPIVRLLVLEVLKYDVNFLENAINIKNIYVESTGVPQLTVPQLSKYNILIPSLQEQIKIGNFFKQLDDIISFYQRELDNLKQMKQGFLQKMFPKEGELVPELRFPKFEDEWKECKIDDLLKINSGRDYKHLQKGTIPVYGTGGYMLSVNDKLSDDDAIGIGRKGTIDKPQLLKAPFWTVDTLFYMTVKKNASLSFCYSLTTKIDWKKYDESTGVPSLSKSSIANISINAPSIQEQVQIGNFFKQLDTLINLHQQELDLLKQTKKAFLQKMFL